jgi:hypothetical protein
MRAEARQALRQRVFLGIQRCRVVWIHRFGFIRATARAACPWHSAVAISPFRGRRR